MKIRILSALVGIVVLVGALICPWTWVFALAAAVLAALAVWELCYNTGKVQSKLLVIVNMVCAAVGVGLVYLHRLSADSYYGTTLRSYEQIVLSGICFVPLVLGVLTILCWLIVRKKVSFTDACYSYLMTLYPAVGFGSLAALRIFDGAAIGLWYILLVLVIPWMSDTGAYFTGYFLGKHKMAPVLSQHKTVEGAIGGVITAIVSMLIYALIMALPVKALSFRVNYLYAVVYGFVGAIAGVFGDLCFSVIKRQTGIKDYGKLLPGHGGVLDRFDSMMMVGPLVEVLLLLIPVIS